MCRHERKCEDSIDIIRKATPFAQLEQMKLRI
jgi:hypothetical protein